MNEILVNTGDLAAQPEAAKHRDLAVAVITPAGIYPDEHDYRRVRPGEKVSEVLAKAAKYLKLTNTSDWVAHTHHKDLDPNQTFSQEGLHGVIEIEWHKHEGGGGA